MRNSTRLALEITAVVVVGIAAFFIGRAVTPGSGLGGPNGNGAGGSANGSDLPHDPMFVSAREEVPSGTTVPSVGASTPENVAAPAQANPAGQGSSMLKRSFALTVEGDTITPDTVIAREGDIVTIWFTAKDKAYSFTQPDFGWGVTLAKGETKSIENQFTQTGKFTFYCPSCGGPAAGPRGYIIVVPKDAP